MKYLKPGSLALGENNAKLNIWHGRYNGSPEDVVTQGFLKSYYKMLAPGDIVHIVVEDEKISLVSLLITENTATPEDHVAKDDFIKFEVLQNTADKGETAPFDVKLLKQQIKAEIARAYGLQKAGVDDGEQDRDN